MTLPNSPGLGPVLRVYWLQWLGLVTWPRISVVVRASHASPSPTGNHWMEKPVWSIMFPEKPSCFESNYEITFKDNVPTQKCSKSMPLNSLCGIDVCLTGGNLTGYLEGFLKTKSLDVHMLTANIVIIYLANKTWQDSEVISKFKKWYICKKKYGKEKNLR